MRIYTTCGSALAQTEELIGTFNALLRIARIEAGERRAKFRMTDLGELAAKGIASVAAALSCLHHLSRRGCREGGPGQKFEKYL